MEDPYRETCSSCMQLKAELEDIRSAVFVYPSQGPDNREPHNVCVFCAEDLKWQGDRRSDWQCNKFEHREWVTSGFWWWKKTFIKLFDRGCPAFPHLHRTCCQCDGEWIEEPYVKSLAR